MKNPKEKKKVPGWSIEEMKERPNIAAERHGRDEQMEKSEPERDGPMLEEVG